MATIKELRLAAAREGLTKFTPPSACKQCGTKERYVSNGYCVCCHKYRTAEYNRRTTEEVRAAVEAKQSEANNG